MLGIYNKWKATKGRTKSRSPARTWRNACERWRWRERAEKWDLHNLRDRTEAAEAAVKEAILVISEAAPDAAGALVKNLREKSPAYRQRAADSILDRTKETATRRMQDVPANLARVLDQIGALLSRYIADPDERAEFEKDLAKLMGE